MLSKNKIKYIHSLELKKTRKEEQVFLAEGPKLTGDLLGRFPCRFLAATSSWLQAHPDIQANEIAEVSQEELSRASLLKTPQQVLAVFEQPQYTLSPDFARQSLCLALDDIQDPGNLGTIIRLADWFGIEHIICSQNTVDVYNPKTIQATMGGIARVKVHYTSLPEFIHSLGDTPVFGTFLDGENMYEQPLSTNGLIVMGNEGNGIGKEVEALINRKLYIPNYPQGKYTLNLDGAEAVIEAADVEIFSEDIPGWLVANEGKLTVALEVTVTEELRREGIARELVNRIQNIRKSSGFEITDKIKITISKNTQTDDAVNEYNTYICNQVLGTSLDLADEVKDGTELNFDDFSLFVNVIKD